MDKVWISVEDRLPVSGMPVLVACGRQILRAAHAAKFEVDEDNYGYFNDGDDADYDEVTDTTYWPEGWYEWNQYEEIHWAIVDHPVTHWMLLPNLPIAA